MKSVTLEVKNLNQARKEAVEKLRISEKYIELEVLDKSGIFLKTLTVEAKVTKDPAEMGYELLEEMFALMDIEANIEMRHPKNNQISYRIETNENPILIGKGGKTLEHIQHYIRNVVNIFSQERQLVLVDIGGYRANRKRQLEILATKTAKQVAKTKIEAKLEPMNAYERRIIHTKLADWRDVTTKSEGEGHKRHLVIKPKRR